MKNTPQNIVLIPAYQPGNSLLKTTDLLLDNGFEVVVVDDGSREDYQSIFKQLDSRINLVSHSANKGKGTALKTGYQYIKEHYLKYVIITADADGQHKVEDIMRIAEQYPTNPGTLLLGSRKFSGGDIPLRSKFGNELTRKVFWLTTKQHLSDTQTGLRAFDDSLTEFMIQIPGERFEYEMNVLLSASREGMIIIELPIQTIYENNNQSSHFNPLKDSIVIYSEVLKFASSSLVSFVIDFAIFSLVVFLTSSWTLATSITFANIFARLISASFNFTVNRRLIFKQNNGFKSGVLGYTLLAIGILIGNTLLLNILTLLSITPTVAKVATELIFFYVSYVVQKHVIFTNKKGIRA